MEQFIAQDGAVYKADRDGRYAIAHALRALTTAVDVLTTQATLDAVVRERVTFGSLAARRT